MMRRGRNENSRSADGSRQVNNGLNSSIARPAATVMTPQTIGLTTVSHYNNTLPILLQRQLGLVTTPLGLSRVPLVYFPNNRADSNAIATQSYLLQLMQRRAVALGEEQLMLNSMDRERRAKAIALAVQVNSARLPGTPSHQSSLPEQLERSLMSSEMSVVTASGTDVETSTKTQEADQQDSSSLMELCRRSQWEKLLQIIKANENCILQILYVDSSNCSGEVKGGRTTTLLHQVLRSHNPDVSGRLKLINTILGSKNAKKACSLRAEPLGSLPLHVALYRDNKLDSLTRERVVEALVKIYPHAVSIQEYSNVRKTGGKTPLHIMGRQYSSTGIARKLIQASLAAVKIRDDKGWLPIHHACRWRSSPEKLKLLIDAYPKSVFQTTHDSLKKTPLDLVRDDATKDRPHLALIAILKDSMASLNSNDKLISDKSSEFSNSNGTSTKSSSSVASPVVNSNNSSQSFKSTKSSTTIRKHQSRPPPTLPIIDLLPDVLSLCHPQALNALYSQIPILSTQQAGSLLHHLLLTQEVPQQQKLQIIRCLTKTHPNSIAIHDSNGSLPLHILFHKGSQIHLLIKLQLLKYFVMHCHPSSCTQTDKQGKTPMHLAAANETAASPSQQSDLLELFQLLHKSSPQSISIPDTLGYLPFHYHILSAQATKETILFFIEQHPKSLYCKTNEGDTPFSLFLSSVEDPLNDPLRLVFEEHISNLNENTCTSEHLSKRIKFY